VISYQWRGEFTNAQVNALHAEGFHHRLLDDDWLGQVSRHSLGWVCAAEGGELVGFVNVPWDGGVHAFIVDTLVTASARHRGVRTKLVEVAAQNARAAGCEWLQPSRCALIKSQTVALAVASEALRYSSR